MLSLRSLVTCKEVGLFPLFLGEGDFLGLVKEISEEFPRKKKEKVRTAWPFCLDMAPVENLCRLILSLQNGKIIIIFRGFERYAFEM